MKELKYCKFCDKEKPVKDFCKSGGAIKNICRECQNRKQKKQYRDAKILNELEEWLKAIMELPKTETNNLISSMNSINVDDLMSTVDRLNKVPNYNDLLKENKKQKEVIDKANKKLNNFIDCCKAEKLESGSDYIHHQYWDMFERFNKQIKDILKEVSE